MLPLNLKKERKIPRASVVHISPIKFLTTNLVTTYYAKGETQTKTKKLNHYFLKKKIIPYIAECYKGCN